MKVKNVLLICSLCISILGCNSKEIDELKNQNNLLVKENNELKNKNDSLIKENDDLKTQIQELSKSIAKLETENSELQLQIEEINKKNNTSANISANFSFINSDLEAKNKYEVHNLHHTLDFEYNGFNTKVYSLPKIEDPIYTIQKGDVVDVFMAVHVIENETDFIAVKVNNEIDGFIKISGNPYKNGNFEVSDTIIVDEIETTILKMEKSFEVSDDGIYIKELPSEYSKNIHKITHAEGGYGYYKSFNITSDYKWVKMQIGDFTGWVPADCLSVGRGGPTLNTPEEFIYFDLIGGNLI